MRTAQTVERRRPRGDGCAHAARRLRADPQELAVTPADSVWALGATGKFVWPSRQGPEEAPAPDHGADTVWGEQDRLVSAVYARELADRIADSRVEIVEGAGHVPQWEQLERVAPLVLGFLAG